MVFHIEGKENQGCNLLEMFPLDVFTTYVKLEIGLMSDIGFSGRGQLWDKMVNLHIAGSILRPYQLRKVCKWAWLVALTDGFDFQTQKTSKFVYSFEMRPPKKGQNVQKPIFRPPLTEMRT